ncbi:glycosyltransferase family 39 protein [Siphonobacter curvatus]|uniref:Glycosyltransferase RgtA/B/C/D-like domain-containing protein n=1 Tax=Siphonobacter curvatus TaxID=2094562 RepID=A0A2S7INP3_9BACT|nr:glycosyltransferase family 39 protein [Siphonobacter curvatus]PQA59344.1 hypothetical protein C5O19_06745 [Siphonobacter curvatus]
MIHTFLHKLPVSETRKKWIWLVGSLLFELIVVLIFSGKRPLPPDYATYTRITDVILAGNGYIDQGKAFTFFPPGYSLYLVPLHLFADLIHVSRPLVVIGMNLWVGAGSLLLIRSIARIYFQDQRAELVPLLWCTYPFQLILIIQPNSEVPFLLFFLASIFLLGKFLTRPTLSYLIGSGLCLGISCLIRPITLYLAIAWAIVLVFKRTFLSTKDVQSSGQLKYALLVWVLSFLLVVFPWELYVYLHNDEWIPVQGKSVLVIQQGLLFGHEMYHGQRVSVPASVYVLMDRIAHAKPTTQAMMHELLHSNGGVLLQLIGLKATRCWYGLWNNPYESFTKWIQLSYLLLALAGFIRYYRTKSLTLISVLPALLILYFWGTTLLLIPLLRYMIPAMPFVFLYVAAFFPAKSSAK